MYLKKKTWDVADIIRQLRSIHSQVNNPHNDGYTASGCKQDLFQLKCIIEDLYDDTPTFVNEEEWLAKRTLELVARQNNGTNK